MKRCELHSSLKVHPLRRLPMTLKVCYYGSVRWFHWATGTGKAKNETILKSHWNKITTRYIACFPEAYSTNSISIS